MIHKKFWFVMNMIDAKGSCGSKMINEHGVFVSFKINDSFVRGCNCKCIFS